MDNEKEKEMKKFRLRAFGCAKPNSILPKARSSSFLKITQRRYFIINVPLRSRLENATVHYKIAEVLSRSSKQDDLLKASLSIEQALKLERKNKYFYLLAANIYNSLTRFDKAAQTYETMIAEIKGNGRILLRTCRRLSICESSGRCVESLQPRGVHTWV